MPLLLWHVSVWSANGAAGKEARAGKKGNNTSAGCEANDSRADNVDQRYTSISLVCGRDQIQGLPITQMDPSQPAGTIPARASASAVQRH